MLRRLLLLLSVSLAFTFAVSGSAFACSWSSWYGPGFYGNLTASGEVFAGEGDYTVAHKTLPFGTVIYAEGAGGGAYFRVNDRGPYAYGRELDFSQPWIVGGGVACVDWEVVSYP